MTNEDYSILKLDLDFKYISEVYELLKERLWYLFITHNEYNYPFLDFRQIDRIELIKKKSYSVKIYFNYPIVSSRSYENATELESLVFFQLLMGSDFKKEINTLRDSYHGREQSNISFDIAKRYKGNKIIIAKNKNITKPIMKYLNDRLKTYEYNKKNNMINIQKKHNKLEVTYNPKKISKLKAIGITKKYARALTNSKTILMKKLNE